MFPTGLTEVMVTPLEPPRLGLDLAPDLVLGLDLCDVLRLLDLPTLAPFSTSCVRCPRTSPARSLSRFPEQPETPASRRSFDDRVSPSAYTAAAGRNTSWVPRGPHARRGAACPG